MVFYAAERKKELLSFVTAWMELESIILSEINQVTEDKYHMISLIPSEQNKQMSKIEPEAWKQGTNWLVTERMGEEHKRGKQGKGLVKEQI